jgi:hypothetical protein
MPSDQQEEAEGEDEEMDVEEMMYNIQGKMAETTIEEDFLGAK